MSNTIKSKDNNGNTIEIYNNKIIQYSDEYRDTLRDRDDIYNNGSLFTGMCKYIYRHVFKYNKIDTSNIKLLDNIWDIYTDMCYSFGKRPTLLNFSLLVGISNDTFTTWATGEYRSNGQGTQSEHSRTVRKWQRECESSLADGATEKNSIGCIFALKANYGWVETPQRIEVSNAQQPQLSDQEIAEIAQDKSEDSDIEPDF